jgi:hypothetical protein
MHVETAGALLLDQTIGHISEVRPVSLLQAITTKVAFLPYFEFCLVYEHGTDTEPRRKSKGNSMIFNTA